MTSVQLRHLAGATPCWRPVRKFNGQDKVTKVCKMRKKHPKHPKHPKHFGHWAFSEFSDKCRPHWLDGPTAPQSVAFRRSKHPDATDTFDAGIQLLQDVSRCFNWKTVEHLMNSLNSLNSWIRADCWRTNGESWKGKSSEPQSRRTTLDTQWGSTDVRQGEHQRRTQCDHMAVSTV